MAIRGKSKLPPAGSLVKLKSFSSKLSHVKIESIHPQGPEEAEVLTVDAGAIGLVIGSFRNDNTNTLVPVILVGDFTGWVYNDEWEYFKAGT